MSRNVPVSEIRPAVGGDLLGVLQLMERDEEGRRPAVTLPSALELSTWTEMLQTQNLTIYVANTAEELIGTASFITMPNLGYGCHPSGFVEAMVVARAHRRRGVATEIMQRILTDAATMGCHKLQLLTHKRHSADGAHDFYRSVGFDAEAEGFRIYLPI